MLGDCLVFVFVVMSKLMGSIWFACLGIYGKGY